MGWKKERSKNPTNSLVGEVSECSIPKYDENTVWFVRTVDGGWFSMDIQTSWMSGELMPVEFDFEQYKKEEEELLNKWLEKYKI